ncbi:MAG: DUF2917 domain-containing protein [Comamonadaceae bacterium]|nr:DUF2917 domain-containing protein [Comamonadaceae bacterium]
MRPKVPGVLRVGQGCVWITLDGPHERRAGDLFRKPGRLSIAAGQRVVLGLFADGMGCRDRLAAVRGACAGLPQWLNRPWTCVWRPARPLWPCARRWAPGPGWSAVC